MTDQTSATSNPATPMTRVCRTFATPRKQVFAAWTSAGAVKQWFSPQYFTVPEAQVEPRQGGVFSLCMRGPDGSESWMRGQFLEFVADERVTFESDVAGPDGEVLFRATTAVNFSDVDGGTRVDVEQQYKVFAPVATQMVKYAALGWEQTFDRLGSMLGAASSATA